MRHKVTLAIAHRSASYARKLRYYLEQNFPTISILDVALSGPDLFSTLLQFNPDIVLTDLVLNRSDALTAIEHANELKIFPRIIMISSFVSPTIMNKVIELNVEQFLLEPVNFPHLRSIIGSTIGYKEHERKYIYNKADHALIYADAIRILLIKLGFKETLTGFNFAKDGIVAGLIDPEHLESFTKYMYPHIAKINQTTASRVERSIRHAILTSFEVHKESYSQFLDIYEKPTNSNFIRKCIKYIHDNRKDF